ncbi:hypothetical protein Tco_1307201, partial [Tanacetum coccineum]
MLFTTGLLQNYVYIHHPITVLSHSYIEDAFSSTKTLDYSPALPGNTSSDSSEDLSKDLLASLTISPFHDDPYMKVMQAYNATNDELPIPPPRAPIAPPTVLPSSPVLSLSPISHKTSLERHEEQIETILNHLDELPLERIEHMEDKIEGLGNGRDFYSGDDHRGYPELDNSLWIIPQPLGSEPVPEKLNEMAPKKTSTSAALAMTQATIKKLVADSVSAALEAQVATMANTDNTNRNTGPRETLVARKCSYKEF